MNKLAFLAVLFLIGLANSLPLNEEEENTNDNQIQSRATVCYDDPIGCFSNDSPWDNALGTLPVDPSELKTEFLLFTRKNPLQEQLLHYKDPESIRSSNFDTTLPLKIIIHGFDNTRETKWLHTMKRTILDIDNVNVMIVGWGNGSAFPYYNNATANIRMVGRELGLLINLIREVLFSSNPKSLNIHCIGHSLGSHTCAYGSNNAKIKFNRISAMDPAGPSFEDTNPVIRVDPTDADFVDVMHTNGGSIISASFGMNMVCGHVDFYVNGGKNQPGCPTGILGSVLDPNGESSCSHSRAYQFYTESISSKCPFTSYTCYSESDWVQGKCTTCANNKCAVMGYWADKYPGRGSVYLATNAQTPFCGHHHIFEMTLASDSPKTAGEIAISFPFSNIDSSYKPLTTNDDNLVANNVVRRVFVTQNDLSNVNHMTMKFNKKPKPLIGQDQNAALLKFTEIQVHSVDLRESYTECAPDVRTLETNKTIDVNIRYKC